MDVNRAHRADYYKELWTLGHHRVRRTYDKLNGFDELVRRTLYKFPWDNARNARLCYVLDSEVFGDIDISKTQYHPTFERTNAAPYEVGPGVSWKVKADFERAMRVYTYASCESRDPDMPPDDVWDFLAAVMSTEIRREGAARWRVAEEHPVSPGRGPPPPGTYDPIYSTAVHWASSHRNRFAEWVDAADHLDRQARAARALASAQAQPSADASS